VKSTGNTGVAVAVLVGNGVIVAVWVVVGVIEGDGDMVVVGLMIAEGKTDSGD